MELNHNLTKHIFLAEDDEDDTLLFTEALSEIDKTVVLTHATNGKKLMEILYQRPDQKPDIVFLDLNMPIRNGYECLNEIRANSGRLKDLHVIVLTTSRQKENIDIVFKLGASRYIVKPSTFTGLKSVLAKVLDSDWTQPVSKRDRKNFVIG